MRLVFCFSRSCRPYPTTLALRSLPCWPGAKLRFSIGHLSLKHLGPFKNNFMPSRRQRRHTGPLYRANFYSPFNRVTIGLRGGFPFFPIRFLLGSATASPAAPSRFVRAGQRSLRAHPSIRFKISNLKSNSASLRRSTTIVRNWGDILNGLHFNSRGSQGADGRFAA